MKIFRIKYLALVLVSTVLWSCTEDTEAVLNGKATIDATASVDAVVLLEANEGEEAVTIAWPEPEYGFSASPTYYIYLDKEGGDFSKAAVINNGANISKVFKTEDLNKYMAQLKLKPEELATVQVKVESRLTSATSIFSEVFTMDVTPYAVFLDLSTTWGVVGGAYNNWGNAPDAPMFTTSSPGVYVAYVKVRAGQIKFRLNNDWGTNYGDTGADGTLEQNGSDITVTAGSKKITVNTNTMTYTIESYSWGIVGSAWNNWGNATGPSNIIIPDLEFTYDDSSDKWRAIGELKAGAFKIRKNSDWGTNYGDTGADGTLEPSGTDITVAAGKYLITFDANALTIEMESITNVWGVVGSAYNNWGQDVNPADGYQDLLDLGFIRDYRTDGIWMLNNVVLQAGAFKVRDANSWTLNYGDTDANGSLEEGGTDISVTGGLYTIKLDFSNAGSPTILVTRWND